MKSSIDSSSSTVPAWESSYLRIFVRAIIWSPWIWLGLFGAFVLATALQMGHLPTYGQPDPKDAGLSILFYMPTILLLMWVLATTPLGMALTLIKLWKDLPQSIKRQEMIFYLGGTGLFYLFILSDVAGLMTWLAD